MRARLQGLVASESQSHRSSVLIFFPAPFSWVEGGLKVQTPAISVFSYQLLLINCGGENHLKKKKKEKSCLLSLQLLPLVLIKGNVFLLTEATWRSEAFPVGQGGARELHYPESLWLNLGQPVASIPIGCSQN